MSDTISRAQLQTVHLVPLTAMDAEGNLNLEAQKAHTERMAAAGFSVYLPAAGTSEFHSLTPEEMASLVKVTREGAGEDAVVFAPVGLQLPVAIEMGKRGLDAGASGILVMPFMHPYLSDEGVMDYLRALMAELRCPMVVYRKANIPTDSLILKLSRDARFIGVKYAVNDLNAFRRTVLMDKSLSGTGNLEWTCGTAERFAPFFMLAGAGGYTTGAGNLCPHLTLAMHAALASGQYEEALSLQELILPIEDYRAREGDSFNISMLKYGMELLGHDFGQARPPQRRLTAEQQQEIEAMLAPIMEAEKRLAEECSSVGLSTQVDPHG